MTKNFKFIISINIILLFINSNVEAFWHKLYQSPSFTLYVDVNNIKTSGDIKKIMELQNLEKVNYKGEGSYRYISEYNCKTRKWRMAYIERYSNYMAKGKLLKRSLPSNSWFEVPLNSAVDKVFSLVCWKKYYFPEIGFATKLNDIDSSNLSSKKGMNVTEINNFGKKNGIKVGDYISHLNNQKINSIKHAKMLIKKIGNNPIVLTVSRNDGNTLILIKSLKYKF